MTKLIVDEALRSKLRNFAEPLELCDESGQVLARVTPIADLSQYEPWEPHMDEEEIRQREQSSQWHSTEQVLAHLRSLEQS